ncbi:MAG: AAA family ATPase [Ruminococcus callidus]
MAKLLCICGKIGCGKTYYANRLKEQEHAVILSTDEVTYDLTNNQQGDGYDEFAIRVNYIFKKKQWKL